jgi:hypothetical protein
MMGWGDSVAMQSKVSRGEGNYEARLYIHAVAQHGSEDEGK